MSEPDRLSGLRLLVVDDNPDVADILSLALTACGAQVTTAYSGDQTLKLFSAAPYDTVILDIGLPDMSGVDVASHLRQAHPACLLIALSGYHLQEEHLTGNGVFNRYLLKPVQTHELIRAIEDHHGQTIDS